MPNPLLQSTFHIKQMDCPSEENLIRLQLATVEGIHQMDFDIAERTLTLTHKTNIALIEQQLNQLNLGSVLVNSHTLNAHDIKQTATNHQQNQNQQRQLLTTVLAINAVFFTLELLMGWFAHSMGLIADSLDMLADAFVYGLSLLAIGTTALFKARVAKIAGWLQLSLALLGFIDVLRRFLGASDMPNVTIMIITALLALLANTYCLYVLQQSKANEAHLKASMIFTANDVLINLGVIIAATLVWLFSSNLPDLIVGTVVFMLVVQGAIRILRLAKPSS